MSETKERGFWGFIAKATAVFMLAGLFFGAMDRFGMSQMTPWAVRALAAQTAVEVRLEGERRATADSVLTTQVSRLAAVLELRDLIDDPSTPQPMRYEARQQLRAMRSLALTPRR
jgi:hypothetical protein